MRAATVKKSTAAAKPTDWISRWPLGLVGLFSEVVGESAAVLEESSLADRSDMKFPMLIGRSSLRRRFVVDSGYSWLQTPERKTKKGHKP